MFATHAHDVIQNGFRKKFYPSLIACYMFLKKEETMETYKQERQDFIDTIRIYAFQSKSFEMDLSDLLPIYTEKGTCGQDLYNISDKIAYNPQSMNGKKENAVPRQWIQNKVFRKDLKGLGIVCSPSKSIRMRRAVS